MHSMQEVPVGDYESSKATWPQDSSVRGKVETAIRSALTKAAEWFLRGNTDINQLPRERDCHCASPQTPELHVHGVGCHWLCRSTEVLSAHAEACQVVCAAKDVWFQATAEEAQKERFSGKGVWK